ncbi:DNA-binding protein [Blastococcus sp. TBT05-19]|uniref:DNA-binding protein n=1 Tax=Blastococcus sp. TBT05-19 TaxID=2250581 RepID=UPI000DEABB4A|nr:DNA-binding protein [Blastococcus sp. TBT05-19]RBY94079.1 DNA-binding protein [Blastococcus sp. TBT05-19]
MNRAWTADEVLALPVVVDLVTAGSVLGMGRSASYEMARRGEFPVPVLKVGHRYRVVSARLRELVGIHDQPTPVTRPATPFRPASGL